MCQNLRIRKAEKSFWNLAMTTNLWRKSSRITKMCRAFRKLFIFLNERIKWLKKYKHYNEPLKYKNGKKKKRSQTVASKCGFISAQFIRRVLDESSCYGDEIILASIIVSVSLKNLIFTSVSVALPFSGFSIFFPPALLSRILAQFFTLFHEMSP